MPNDLDSFRTQLSVVRQLFAGIDWRDPLFTPEKACVGAAFAKIAYLEIPDFELRHHSAVKIIPCLTYQELVARGVVTNVADFVRNAELGDPFVVVTRYVVAVGIARQDVIFVALRGTRPLYVSDWWIDFHFKKLPTYVDRMEVKFHSGFYLAISECLDQIGAEVQKRNAGSPRIPVYVVGHSLGGAMAAIMYALDGATFYTYHRYGMPLTAATITDSSFTFGMPRYGDHRAVALRSPFHVYNKRDLFPGLPTRWMGFADAPAAYRADIYGSLRLQPQDTQGPGWWLDRLPFAGVKEHSIEDYITGLGRNVGLF